MNKKKKLSIITTVYNGEKYLCETLDAVLAQTFSDWEMVIVNNCSTDGTQAILDIYDDPRIRIIYPEQHGTFGDGIRLAYANASSEFIAVQDGDDIPYPTRLERQINELENNKNLGLVSCWYDVIDKNSIFLEKKTPPYEQQDIVDAYQSSNPLYHSTYMYRKEYSDAVGGYPETYNFGPDFALAIRMVKAGYGISCLPEYLFKIRSHDQQASVDPKLAVMRSSDSLNLFIEASQISGLSDWAVAKSRKNLIKRSIQYATALIFTGKWAVGGRLILMQILKSPVYSILYLFKHLFLN